MKRVKEEEKQSKLKSTEEVRDSRDGAAVGWREKWTESMGGKCYTDKWEKVS